MHTYTLSLEDVVTYNQYNLSIYKKEKCFSETQDRCICLLCIAWCPFYIYYKLYHWRNFYSLWIAIPTTRCKVCEMGIYKNF